MTDLPMPVNRARIFSASNAARFMACHAAANLEAAIPGWVPPVVDPNKGAKGKGTAMHEVLEKALSFTAQEMLALSHALTYVAELRRKRRFKVLVEETATAEWLPSQPKTTVDLVLYTADELHIIDYKFGRIPVTAHDNKQLLYYAITFAHLAPKAKGVHAHIVQPLIYNIEEVWIPMDELVEFMKDAIATDQAILGGDLTFGPSDNCTFCAAYPHSRGDKGSPMCPATMALLYPPRMDEDEILNL